MIPAGVGVAGGCIGVSVLVDMGRLGGRASGCGAWRCIVLTQGL